MHRVRPEVGHGDIWVVERPRFRGGRVVESSSHVILIHYAPPDWRDPPKAYGNHLRLIRTHLRFGVMGAKPDDYIMDDLRWLWNQRPKEPYYWSWRLWHYEDVELVYKQKVYTWR